MQIEKVKIKDLVEYEGNAKLHPQEQINKIKKSIQEFGNNDPSANKKDNYFVMMKKGVLHELSQGDVKKLLKKK
nr:MAG TPA: ParB protein [Caudoviricetes sp.]